MYKCIFDIKNCLNSINVSQKWSLKRLWLYYVLRLEIGGSLFSFELYGFSLYCINLN